MSDKDRDHAAEQQNSAVNLANLDVDDASIGETPDIVMSDLDQETTYGENDKPQPDRTHRKRQE